jgi:solute carrier family 35, member F5
MLSRSKYRLTKGTDSSQTVFADKTYAKPFFLTYLNTAVFVFTLIPVLFRSGYRNWRKGTLRSSLHIFKTHTPFSKPSLRPGEAEAEAEAEAFLKDDDAGGSREISPENLKHLDTWSTARLSFYFCILWFFANYFAMSCLQYTTVASTTILTSTSSVWTLLIGAITRTEKFTWRKLIGVVASLVGVFLISQVDLSSSSSSSPQPPTTNNPTRKRDGGLGESFPSKTPAELAFGDAMAAFSALIYGIYTITLKRTTNAAAREGKALNMPLFFGLVGLINTILLFPLFPILSVLKVETFQLPPTRRIWTILLVNSASSLLSDICWAYAMVLTSPLVVTVGLSLTIPLSLVGELIVQGRSESVVYWIGAIIVVCSFVFVNREEVKEGHHLDSAGGGDDGVGVSAGRELGDSRTGYASVEQHERSSGDSAR